MCQAVIHAVDQEAPLQPGGVVHLHTHLSTRDATHILHRVLHQDLQNLDGEEPTINALLDVEDLVRVVDQSLGLVLTLVLPAVHPVQPEAHPEALAIVQDPIQNLIRAHLVMTSRQLVQTNAHVRTRAPHRQLITN